MGKLGYVGYLDGFRGFFCLLIVAYHWPMKYMSISFGWEVLQTFFVISGYLITRILLNDKSKNPEFKDIYNRFLYRRSFRIFPLYFGFVGFWTLIYFVGILIQSGTLKMITEDIGTNGVYLYTYVYNFASFFNFFRGVEDVNFTIFGHLWSLSLEEQYYLTIPIIIYFLSRKQLLYGVIGIIIITPLVRYFGYEWMMSVNPDHKWASVNLYRMMPFQMDSFAIGTLLALTGFKRIKRHVFATWSLFVVIILVYVGNRYLVEFQGSSFQAIGGNRNLEQWLTTNYQHVYLFTLVNFGAAFAVMSFERGAGLIPWLFSNKLMVYFGKISYGIYVFHIPILYFWLVGYASVVPLWVKKRYEFLYEIAAWLPYIAIVLLFSHLSYKYYEMYFLHLKEKVDAKKFAKLRGKG
ncbi:MAG: acyltransferase [Chitinophagales bacterium]|nr:acyltransferase [Chitinophagales bacterium]